jgi:transposase
VHCHPNAHLTPRGRARVFAAVEAGMTVSAACIAFRVSRRCYYRWLPRWQEQGRAGLIDRSRPHRSPQRLSLAHEQAIVTLRQ